MKKLFCPAGISAHKTKETHIITILISLPSNKSAYSLLMTLAVLNIDAFLMPFLFSDKKGQIFVHCILNMVLLTTEPDRLLITLDFLLCVKQRSSFSS